MRYFDEYVFRAKELNSDVKIRPAEIEDGNHFVSLFNSHYARKTKLSYFHWQFFNSPFNSKLFTAFEGEKLVGYYGIKIMPLTHGFSTGFAVDFLTEESYRKRGVAYLLEEAVLGFCLEEGVGTLVAFPNKFGNAAFKSLGWKSVTKIDTLIKDDFNSTIPEQLVDNVGINPLIGFHKDAVYRKWRFSENPIYQYEVINVDDNTFATTKLFEDPITGLVYGDIVNLEFGSSLRSQKLLLNRIIDDMKDKNVKAVTTWALPHAPEYSFLLGLGFRALPQERYFCVKVLNSNLEPLTQISNWRLEESDAEIF